MPGVDPKALDIRVENNVLTIRGERKFEKKVEQDNYLRVERAYGSFTRSFALANTVKPEGIKADYNDGVLIAGDSEARRSQAEADQSERRRGSGSGRRRSRQVSQQAVGSYARGWQQASPFFVE